MTRNTQDPIITIIVGTRLLPMPLDALIVQSIKGATAKENHIIPIRSIPASITAPLDVNSDKNSRPDNIKIIPRINAVAVA